MEDELNQIIPLGTETPFGIVSAISFIQGERCYWLIGKKKSVSMIPSDVLLESIKERSQNKE